MKRILIACGMFAAVAGSGRADEKKFSQSVSPEDFTAAGLDRLSPAEISRLDALITAYKNGAVATVRRSADEALAAKQAALVAKQAAEAEAKAAKDEVVEYKKTNLGFFSKAKILLMPGTKVEYAVIKSTIPGKFRGWDGRPIFLLANGQRWQVANGGNYYTPAKDDIEVEITQSSLGGYWMRFPALNAQVRVKLLPDK